eukprot:CAMPEP_0171225574 /NCGR_PEP_ID=MMETSP0790-20130122/36876_1 /TAXON_ID=2925 /ORGANISM="Alexandrium catenella, Strain OF101" /LENGTH=55 /DNA_ID=CAMNT_0011691609 /DNA_START=67 /DNA_END=235 /DNA_ORIENTATION=-
MSQARKYHAGASREPASGSAGLLASVETLCALCEDRGQVPTHDGAETDWQQQPLP